MASIDRPGSPIEQTSSASPAVDTPTPTEVALEQLFDSESLFQLRSAVAAHGAALGLVEPGLGDLVLVAHELASNAIRHGGANADTPGRLRLWRVDGAVICEVRDDGPGMADPEEVGTVQAPPGAAGGRGLWIVRQVARVLDIATGPTGTTVRAHLSSAG